MHVEFSMSPSRLRITLMETHIEYLNHRKPESGHGGGEMRAAFRTSVIRLYLEQHGLQIQRVLKGTKRQHSGHMSQNIQN